MPFASLFLKMNHFWQNKTVLQCFETLQDGKVHIIKEGKAY